MAADAAAEPEPAAPQDAVVPRRQRRGLPLVALLALLGAAPSAAWWRGVARWQNVVIGTRYSLLATNAVLLFSAALMLGLIALVWFPRPPLFAAGAAH